MYWLNHSTEINRTNYFDQYRCCHTYENASMKLIIIWFVHSTFFKQKNTTSLLVKEMQIMSDSQVQYTSNKNQFQNNYMYDGMKTLSVDKRYKINLCCIIAYFSKRKDRLCMALDRERRYNRIIHEPPVCTIYFPLLI